MKWYKSYIAPPIIPWYSSVMTHQNENHDLPSWRTALFLLVNSLGLDIFSHWLDHQPVISYFIWNLFNMTYDIGVQKINTWLVTKTWHAIVQHSSNVTLFSDKTKKMLGRYMSGTSIQRLTSNNWENTFQCLVQSNGLFCRKMHIRSDQIEDSLLSLLHLRNPLKLRAL